ncbi:MAG TPA: GNAT family N-acetyltransferase [Abditibacterium sp.]|jgi:ribosomal-protein-alanine N-acetyltransferase
MPPVANIVIRKATSDDARSVLEMLRELEGEPNLNSAPGEMDISEEKERAFLQKMSDSADHAFFVALVDNAIVGSLGVHSPPRLALRHSANLGMSVRGNWRNQGIGSALLQRSIEWARMRQVARLSLTVYARNRDAIRFYERFGFEIEGHHPRMFCKNGEYLEGLTMGLLLDS